MPEPRIDARRLVREFAPGIGVLGVDLTVDAGEIHALVGLNGAGKTTLLKLLLGMLRPDSGEITIVGLASGVGAAWAHVGHALDQPPVHRELTSRTNVALAARLHGMPKRAIPAEVTRTLRDLDLTRYATVRGRALSAGNRQRLGVAMALVHSPAVIVLDEPTSALDPAGIILLREQLRRRADDGAGILVSSHHLDELARIADRISIVNAGRIIGALDPRGEDLERTFFSRVHADDERRAS